MTDSKLEIDSRCTSVRHQEHGCEFFADCAICERRCCWNVVLFEKITFSTFKTICKECFYELPCKIVVEQGEDDKDGKVFYVRWGCSDYEYKFDHNPHCSHAVPRPKIHTN